MDLDLGHTYDAFRYEVRVFAEAAWVTPDEAGRAAAERDFRIRAAEAGYLYAYVPREYGGGGGGHDQLKATIVREELARIGAPGELDGIGTRMLVPTLLAKGADWQKEKFIRPTLLGDFFWCQGYSEPGSGSDLASLKTKAELVGDEWIINGSKIWTSGAHRADYMFILVRSEPDAAKHQGISYLLLDMKTPGITIRPLKQIHGDSDFNQVFFDDVRTPSHWIVGERGGGWNVSRVTVAFERAMINGPDAMDPLIDRLKRLARTTFRDGRPLMEREDIIQAFGILEGHRLAHRYSVMRQNSMDSVGQNPGIATLVNKLYGTDIGLKIAELAQEIQGDNNLLMPAEGTSRENMDWPYWIMRSLGTTIAGGTSNIQRNIIAERGLGLPRDASQQ